jgi:hypothetical protein
MSFLKKIQSRYKLEATDLPSKLVLDVDKDIDIDQEGADILSDKMGFCVESFNFKILSTMGNKRKVQFYNIIWDTTE